MEMDYKNDIDEWYIDESLCYVVSTSIFAENLGDLIHQVDAVDAVILDTVLI